MPQQPPQQDTIYQAYDRSLYKLTGQETFDNIMDALDANAGANNSAMVNVPTETIGSGVATGTSSQSTGALESGKQAWSDSTPGYFLGIDTDGTPKFNIGSGTAYVRWDGSSLSVAGGISASSLNIPDTTTANSFHVDSGGNTWWGANVAAGLSAASASVTNAGAAVFKNVAIGGVQTQYVITNSGIFSYGDGSDGVAICDGSTAVTGMTLAGSTYTMNRDAYFSTLTVNDGIDIITNGYRLFCQLSLTVGGGTSGKVHWDGTAGTAGNNGVIGNISGVNGTGLATGYLNGSVAGGSGGGTSGAEVPSGGINGTNVSNSLGTNGVGAGNGGTGRDSINVAHGGASGGVAGTATASNVKLIANWHLATLLDIASSGATVKFNNSAGAAGGGAGGQGQNSNGGSTTSGGGGGAGGSAGGIVAIYAKVIVINAGAVISSNGGAGGAGGPGFAGTNTGGGSGGGGGGGGGNGGIIVLTYNSLTDNGSISVAAGAGGGGGAGGNGGGHVGTNGTTGSTGSVGTIYEFQLSL